MRTSDVDLAAAIIAETSQHPTLSLSDQPKPLHHFTFPDTELIVATAARYASGELFLSAKHLLSCRSMLFRQMRGGRR